MKIYSLFYKKCPQTWFARFTAHVWTNSKHENRHEEYFPYDTHKHFLKNHEVHSNTPMLFRFMHNKTFIHTIYNLLQPNLKFPTKITILLQIHDDTNLFFLVIITIESTSSLDSYAVILILTNLTASLLF